MIILCKILIININKAMESKCNSIARMLSKKLELNHFEVEQINLSNYKINYCTGCKSCFYTGLCREDLNDDFTKLRVKIRNSRIIIFIIPVYFLNVPGIIKTVIDRTSFNTHLMSYAGKRAINIVVSTLTGGKEVLKYLYKYELNLGMYILNNIEVLERDVNNKIVDLAYNCIIDNSNKDLHDLNLELIFKRNKSFYSRDIKYLNNEDNFINNEILYWSQSWIQETQTFDEYALKNISRLEYKNIK